MQLDRRTTVDEALVDGLWNRKQVTEDLRVPFELTVVDLEGCRVGDKDDIAIRKPDVRSDESLGQSVVVWTAGAVAIHNAPSCSGPLSTGECSEGEW
jgi:hypothetical protein